MNNNVEIRVILLWESGDRKTNLINVTTGTGFNDNQNTTF